MKSWMTLTALALTFIGCALQPHGSASTRRVLVLHAPG